MFKISLTLLGAAFSIGAFAQPLAKAGLSGELTGLIGFSSGKSNFNTDEKEKEGELNSEAKSKSEALYALLGQVRYTFGKDNDHQLFLGTSRDDIAKGEFVLEAGYKIGIGEESTIALSYLPGLIAETWEDPYVTGKRKTTDISSDAIRLKYVSILDSNFSADLAYDTLKLGQEKSGYSINNNKAISSLDRDGDGVYSKLSYSYKLNDMSLIEPSVIFRSFSADGKAMSNTSYGVELSYMRFTGHHAFIVSTDYMKTSFDDEHFVFAKKREDSRYSVFAAYEYDNFMGLDDWAFNSIAGYDVNSSNIDFYKENELIVGAGLTYKF
ncbi:hypothetical protein TUMSATVNIG1_43940 [Vibrio nigripulchritudo]|uniref:DUF2860 family protein n=1 Tax=Vibrio nigripulchritudo TaxID=28173 RepID=UPI00190C31FB|nr:DUF2860 family protein [Vibrio nigripulchritudo]BCL72424.1 hypothetical protein VNTUMSATTG_43610 [Vibrio nigripulchritudo]BDU33785.1 hypothetical protein TUMSATVNIG1_43940 [Vibrio nigripulchritudo]